MLAAACLVAPAKAEGQGRTIASAGVPAGPSSDVAAQGTATFATRAPVLDGRGDDAVWATAPEISDFKVYDPEEGRATRFRTTAQVAYDAQHLYVLVRAHDPAPDSIVGMLSRRDASSPSDWIRVMVDSYHDRRTGYQFIVNPAGVQRDVYIFNDGNEDLGWDAVWQVKTRTDSAGWTAEYAIPWSQLRYPTRERHSIGLMIIRSVARLNESQSWPMFKRNGTGFVSQFGTVAGIDGLPANRRAELMPYVVQREFNRDRGRAPGFVQKGQLSVGADLKYGLTSNVTVDATFNPDFGQVEADPATYNLSTTENYFSERRPFFMEGMGIFRFDMSCNDGDCRGMFYSRRIGQAPALGRLGDEATPTQTTILGAAKITGRTNSGLSVGLLNAVTQRELGRVIVDTATGRATDEHMIVEPMTSFTVARAQQEFRQGNTVVGVMGTGVNRRLEDDSTDYNLRRAAYAGGLDVRHRFLNRRYELSGYAATSRIEGSATAIDRAQRSGVHAFDRVDADLGYDPTRTALAGSTGQLFLNKTAGFVRFSSGYSYIGSGSEINDAGFLGRADMQQQSNWMGLRWITPRSIYRMVGLNFNQYQSWNTAGDRLNLGGNINAHSQLKNNWFVYAGGGGFGFASHNDRDARGGPLFRRNPVYDQWVGVESDGRKPVMGWLNYNHAVGDVGRTRYQGVSTGVMLRPSSNFSLRLGPGFNRTIDDAQWYGAFRDADDGEVHYTFARMDQKTLSMTTRVDFAATPRLSIQVYAQPFVTVGSYVDPRRLSDTPRADAYDDRFEQYQLTVADTATPGAYMQVPVPLGGFNFKQFNSNTVLRWEYRPGSQLFFVWAQGRVQDDRNAGDFGMRRDARDLFRAHPSNTFIVKASYWLSL